jgi:hypothetical protein
MGNYTTIHSNSKSSNHSVGHSKEIHCHENGTVAQSVEQRTFNPLVASSNLARPTIVKGSVPDTWFTPLPITSPILWDQMDFLGR